MRILCLANSFKEGGRCIAGVLLNDENTPVIENNKPIWIRPICKDLHGQVPIHLSGSITPLDIIEIDKAEVIGEGYQSENTTFDEKKILIVQKADERIIKSLHSDTELIFGNRGKALPEDTIRELDHSLILVNSEEFKVIEVKYEEKKHPKVRLNFTYNGDQYDFPITDPVFLENYSKDKNILKKNDSIDIVLSLGVPYKGWYYKLVATILH